MFNASDVAKCSICCFFVKQTVCVLVVTYVLGNERPFDTFGCFLFLVIGKEQAVHFRPQADTFQSWERVTFILKLSNAFGVLLVVNWVPGWIVRGIKEVQIFIHIPVHIVCTNIVAQTVCVCERESGSFTVFLDNVIVMEFIHVKFGYIQYAHPTVDRFVETHVCLDQVDDGNLMVDDLEPFECGTSDIAFPSLLAFHNPNVQMPSSLFHGLSIHRIIHELKQIFLKGIFGCQSLYSIKIDIRL